MQRADFEIYHFRLGTEENHRFEAAAAEAELDMLLGSSETSLSGSMPAGLINETSALKSSNFGFTAPDIGRSTSQDPDSSANNVPTSSSDDSIDDLLTETSLPRMTRSMEHCQKKKNVSHKILVWVQYPQMRIVPQVVKPCRSLWQIPLQILLMICLRTLLCPLKNRSSQQTNKLLEHLRGSKALDDSWLGTL